MKYLIYGKNGCPSCVNAKNLCIQNSLEYDYKIVGSDIQKEQLEEMAQRPLRTVPQIFLSSDGMTQYIGGYEDFYNHLIKGSKEDGIL
jgi:glutaredoxin